MLISCHRKSCYYPLSFSAPRGVNKGQLTSTSGTSAAHLGDGCRGYRPRGAVCIHYGRHVQWGLRPGEGSAAAAVPRDRVRTSGTASWAVALLSHTLSEQRSCVFIEALLKCGPFYCHTIKCIQCLSTTSAFGKM